MSTPSSTTSESRTPAPPSRITFVVPTLNAASCLPRCLDSIYAQEHKTADVEVILVDGGSEDSTLEIAHEYPCKILHNPTRFEDGREGGKAIGFRNAIGEIAIFMDADNELHSTRWLHHMIAPFMAEPDLVGCFPTMILRAGEGTLSRYLSRAYTQPMIRFWEDYGYGTTIRRTEEYTIMRVRHARDMSNGSAVRRDALIEVGGYDFGFETPQRLIKVGLTKFAWSHKAQIYHHMDVQSLRQFVKKRIARINRFAGWNRGGQRPNTLSLYRPSSGTERLRLIAHAFGLTPPFSIVTAVARAAKEGDAAWLYHPIVAALDLVVHFTTLVTSDAGRDVLRTVLT